MNIPHMLVTDGFCGRRNVCTYCHVCLVFHVSPLSWLSTMYVESPLFLAYVVVLVKLLCTTELGHCVVLLT